LGKSQISPAIAQFVSQSLHFQFNCLILVLKITKAKQAPNNLA